MKKIKLPEPDFLSSLNEQQKQAVQNTEGPLLVLSGAGTGKTKVLTSRLANIIYNRKAKMSEIFCVISENINSDMPRPLGVIGIILDKCLEN